MALIDAELDDLFPEEPPNEAPVDPPRRSQLRSPARRVGSRRISQSRSQSRARSRSHARPQSWSPPAQQHSDQDSEHDSDVAEEEVFELEPPPEVEYESLEAAKKAGNAWASKYGYWLVCKNGKPNSEKKTWFYYFRCRRGGKLANTRKLTDEQRVRTAKSSYKQDCPMRVILRASDRSNPSGKWQIKYCRGEHNGIEQLERFHNHPAEEPKCMAPLRRQTRTKMVEEVINNQADSNIRVANSAIYLMKQHPDSMLFDSDIRNIRNRAQLAAQATETRIEQLFRRLDEGGYEWTYSRDQYSGEIDYILVLNRRALEIMQKHPHVLGMDCTYSTNQYERPLLNMVCQTPQNTTIHIGFALLSGFEGELEFTPVLSDLKSKFAKYVHLDCDRDCDRIDTAPDTISIRA